MGPGEGVAEEGRMRWLGRRQRGSRQSRSFFFLFSSKVRKQESNRGCFDRIAGRDGVKHRGRGGQGVRSLASNIKRQPSDLI